MRRKSLLAAAIGLSWLFQFCGSGRTPPGQPPLAQLTPENFASLQHQFNQARNSLRVVTLLSPT